MGHSPFFARRGLFGHYSIVILDLLEPGFALWRNGESERVLVELKWEDSHISIKAVLGNLQIPFSWASYQFPVLQDQNVVCFLACLEIGGRKRKAGVRHMTETERKAKSVGRSGKNWK